MAHGRRKKGWPDERQAATLNKKQHPKSRMKRDQGSPSFLDLVINFFHSRASGLGIVGSAHQTHAVWPDVHALRHDSHPRRQAGEWHTFRGKDGGSNDRTAAW